MLLSHLPTKTVILCRYNHARFDDATIPDVLQTHPVAILGNQVCNNPYNEPSFVPAQGPQASAEFKRKRATWWITELKRTHAAEKERERVLEQLRQSERRLAEAQQVGHIGSRERDLRTNQVIWSDELYRLFGVKPGEVELSYERFLRFIVPEEVDRLRSLVDEAIRDRGPFIFDYRIILADGSVRVMHEQGIAIVNAYPDWQDATRTQAEALHGLLRRWRQGPADIVDVACGIGTQLIGLARLGHRLTGSDISVRAVERASRECDAADVRARLLVADMRSLPLADSCADVVVCADNALPHLLTDDDVLGAFAEMGRILRPGGTVIVTTRDYDRILADPPASTLPQVFAADGQRVISFQLWTWRVDSDVYDLEHFQVHEDADGARADGAPDGYLSGVPAGRAHRAGRGGRTAGRLLARARESGFFQPVMTARR